VRRIPATIKAEVRRRIGAELGTLNVGARGTLDQSICQHIARWENYCAAKQVFGYLALGTEVSLDALYDDVVSAQKRLYLPQVAGDGSLNYSAWKPGDPLVAGRYGQLEPVSRMLPLATRSLVLVPGVAFDIAGRRLGRGSGCYDRALPWLECFGPTVGLAYSKQLLQTIPYEDHDRSVEWVATELGLKATCERPLI
jgi:5-formyltetrahydrofolate cyclo-ligase